MTRRLPGRSALPVFVGLAALAALVAVPAFANNFQLILITRGLVWAVLAASLWFLLRICDLPSFGHAAFFGVAAYVTGVGATRWGVDNIFVALVLGVAITCVVALPLALVASRLKSIFFLLVTLAFAEMLRSLALRWRALGGSDGLVGVVRPDAWPLPVELSQPRGYFFFALGTLVVCLCGLHVVTRSAFGGVLVGIRESDTRMAALGYNPAAYRAVAIMLSVAVAAVAGVLHAYLNRFVNPEDLGALVSARALLTVVVGGVPLVGPPLVAIVLTVLEDVLSSHTDRWLAALGGLYIVVSLLSGGRLPGLGRRRRSAATVRDGGSDRTAGPASNTGPEDGEPAPEPRHGTVMTQEGA